MQNNCVSRPECLVDLPLSQFPPGQTICFKKSINGKQDGYFVGKFVALKNNVVHIKVTGVTEPDWYDARYGKIKVGEVVRVIPKSCFLWGRDAKPLPGLTHSYCHWFRDTTTSVTE